MDMGPYIPNALCWNSEIIRKSCFQGSLLK
jgi:hypothetical protein